MVEKLVKYGISAADNKCTVCGTSVFLDEIAFHVEKKSHLEREKHQYGTNVYPLEEVDEERLKILIDNKILIIGYKQYICAICHCCVSCLSNVVQHIKGRSHKSRIEAAMKKTKNDPVIQTIISMENTMNAVAYVINKLSIEDKSHDLIIPDNVHSEIKGKFNDLKKLKENPENGQSNNVLKYFNKIYNVQAFDLEHEIFVLNEQTLNELRLSYQFSYSYMKNKTARRYCLLCEKDCEYFHDHLCSSVHRSKLTTSNTFLNNGMKKEVEMSMFCHPCNVTVDSNRSVEHIKHKAHTSALLKWIDKNDSELNMYLCEREDLWYSIQNYCCIICSKRFEFKAKFIQHIQSHPALLTKSIALYCDFCKLCATMWLHGNNTNIHLIHCKDNTHKYIESHNIYSVPELPSCVVILLQNAKCTVIQMYNESIALLTQKALQKEAMYSLENLITREFPSAKVYLYGSKFTGLQFADSDVDVYIDYNGNSYYQNEKKNNEKIIKCIEKCIKRNDQTWEIKETLNSSRTPIIRIINRLKGTDYDISFTNGLSVENSKLIRYLIMSYPILHKLILFIKKWLCICGLPGPQCISNYALTWLVIFYFQQRSESNIPSIIEIINQNQSRNISHWRVPDLPVTYTMPAAHTSVNNEREFVTHLIQFFEFYANFDYQYDIVCPLMGYTVKKRSFAEVTTLPEEMKSYLDQLRSPDPEYFRIDSPMCVQDPYDLSHNLTRAVTTFTLNYFRQFCQKSAKKCKSQL